MERAGAGVEEEAWRDLDQERAAVRELVGRLRQAKATQAPTGCRRWGCVHGVPAWLGCPPAQDGMDIE